MNGFIHMEFKEENGGTRVSTEGDLHSNGSPAELVADKLGLVAAFISALDVTYMDWEFIKLGLISEEFEKLGNLKFAKNDARDIFVLAHMMPSEVIKES